MKKMVLLLLAFACIAYADNVTYEWNSTLFFAFDSEAYGVAIDSQNNSVFSGYIFNFEGGIDFFVVKLDSSGSQLWNFTYNNGAEEVANDVAIDSEDNVIAVGYEADGDHLLVFKFNSSGSQLWNKTFDDPAVTDIGMGVAIDSNDNVIVGGKTIVGGNYAYLIIKYNSSGDYQWNSTCAIGNELQDVAVDSADNIIATGGYQKYFTIKFNSSGSALWNATFNQTGSNWAYGVAVDSSDNVIVTGTSNSTYFFTIKYNSSGSFLWNATDIEGEAYDVTVDAFDNIYVAGYSYNGVDLDAYFVKYNSSGDFILNQTFDSGDEDVAYAIANGSVAIAGYSTSGGVKGFMTAKYKTQESQPETPASIIIIQAPGFGAAETILLFIAALSLALFSSRNQCRRQPARQ
ncbi:MAG: hypothetical protein QXO69_01755 [archaeon]